MLMRHQEIQYVPAQAIEVETIVKVIQHCYCLSYYIYFDIPCRPYLLCLLFNYLCKTIKSFKYKLWCDLSWVIHYFFRFNSTFQMEDLINHILYIIQDKKSKLIKRKDCSNTTCTVNCQIPGITLCKLCYL